MSVRIAVLAGLVALIAAAPAQADTWAVTNGSSDATTPTCNVDLHTCVSLRTALAASEATKDTPDVINVPAGTININNDLVIASDITVNGVSARSNFIDGGFKYRGLRITPSGSAKLNHFTIRNAAGGQGGTPDGGGILNDNGVAQLSYVRVTTSHPGAGGSGGGIANVEGTMTLSHALIDDNTGDDGAGLANIGGAEPVQRALLGLVDSTVFKNIAGIGGTGGIDSRGGTANLVILNRVTMADNVGGARGLGGLQILSGSAQVLTSIIARNTVQGTTANCGDVKPVSSTNNVENEKECGFDLGGVNPGLETALANGGGEVDVLALTTGSRSIDRLSGSCGANVTDQRNLPRPQGSGCDAGAYEFEQAPTVTIASGPNGAQTSTSASFAFSTTEPGVTLQCRLTGPGQAGTFSTCSSPTAQAYSGLPDGSFTFSVRALDGVNANPPVSSRSFSVDTLAPQTTITGNPPASTNDNTPTFTFVASEAATFQCRVDAADFVPCTSPYTTAPLAQGPHTFQVRAIDTVGHVDASPSSHSFTMDATPPETTLAGDDPSGPSIEVSPAFAFSSSESGATFECSLDGGAFEPCSSPRTYTGLAAGPHTFSVRAVDAIGNRDASPATRSFTVEPAVVQQATPTPTPSATPLPPPPPPPPTPTFHQSVVVQPAGGTILVRLNGTTKFEPLDVTKGIPLGSEVDARKGKVQLTSVPKAGGTPESAFFYDGLFIVTQSGAITELKLSEKLTGCKAAKKKAAAAAKKPKTRKLWGDGKGSFRTRGQYSAATVRGTKWLVQDTCTTTLTRVTQGVVAVEDFAKKKTQLIKQGKRYTARPKKR